MSARQPSAAELEAQFVNGDDLSYDERAALLDDFIRATVAEAEAGADAYGERVLPVQGGAQ